MSPSDPEPALLGVKPIDAEYWGMFETAQAYFSGEKPDAGDADKHAKTKL